MQTPEASKTSQPRIKLIRKPALIDKIQLSDVSIYRLEKAGKFPKRLRLGANSVAWIESEIDEWIKKLAAAR